MPLTMPGLMPKGDMTNKSLCVINSSDMLQQATIKCAWHMLIIWLQCGARPAQQSRPKATGTEHGPAGRAGGAA